MFYSVLLRFFAAVLAASAVVERGFDGVERRPDRFGDWPFVALDCGHDVRAFVSSLDSGGCIVFFNTRGHRNSSVAVGRVSLRLSADSEAVNVFERRYAAQIASAATNLLVASRSIPASGVWGAWLLSVELNSPMPRMSASRRRPAAAVSGLRAASLLYAWCKEL